MAKKQDVEFPFHHYLNHFYRENKGRIQNHYRSITRKFLDYNNPDNPTAFLRRPQYEALEIYIFLKEYLGNTQLHEIMEEWYEGKDKFSFRSFVGKQLDDFGLLFDNFDEEVFANAFEAMKEGSLSYPNYIFALTMGIGKTVLMATSIFYEFLLANKFPKDERFCHNALVFAPDKTVLQSLKEIQTFELEKVVPPEYVSWLRTNLQFHFLDDTGASLNTIDRSKFNIIISNTQKIILKKKSAEPVPANILFEGNDSKYTALSTSGLEGFEDLYDLESETGLKTNQRFAKLLRLEQLGIYVDEAHHVFGNKLAKDMMGGSPTSLRLTINEIAANLTEAGTRVVSCYNYTGTPFAKNRLLPEVVYEYGLKKAIDREYLKQVTVKGYGNAKSDEFLTIAIKEFWETYGENRYEGMRPKIALFAATIDELQNELRPTVEKILHELGISLNRVLINVGDDKLTSNDDLREFINLDTPESDKQFILLVNKGKEGWNCRSLFAVALYRKPKSKIFVLQATMRCLRSITDIQQSAIVSLSKENMDILQKELEENFRLSIEEFNESGDKASSPLKVHVVKPPVVISINRKRYLYNEREKDMPASIDLGLDAINPDHYRLTREERKLETIQKHGQVEEISVPREEREYSHISLVFEISRYLNRSPLKVESLLEKVKGGSQAILQKINQYNEILYDHVIPGLFNELVEIDTYEKDEVVEVPLVKEPDDGYYLVKGKPGLVAQMKDAKYTSYSDRSFHLDTYCFDSQPEKKFYDDLLQETKNKEVYFTGMLTHGQSDFLVHYIDPESHSLRSYYPDFLVRESDSSYIIYEVKGDNMAEDPVVQAKKEYAEKMARDSGMKYAMKLQSEIMGTASVTQSSLFFIEDYQSRAYQDALPLYSLKAACGNFGAGEAVEPEGWVEVPEHKGMGEGWFVARAEGRSMEPKIHDGDLCIFRPVKAGAKQGQILLVQHHEISDPDTGGAYTLKKYSSRKVKDGTGNEEVILSPLNKDYDDIILTAGDEDFESEFRVIAQFVQTIQGSRLS